MTELRNELRPERAEDTHWRRWLPQVKEAEPSSGLRKLKQTNKKNILEGRSQLTGKLEEIYSFNFTDHSFFLLNLHSHCFHLDL